MIYYSEQSSDHELIEFTLKSLRELIPLAGFKYVKSRKALEMKTQELLISFYLQQLLSDPQCVIEENTKMPKRILSPYFYYRYGTEGQFEQARQRYVANLSEAQKKQNDDAVMKFQADGCSPIRLGEDWVYLTVAKTVGREI